MWTATLFFLSGGLACLFAIVVPVSSTEPVHVDAAVGSLACLIALGVWAKGKRMPLIAFELTIALGTILISTIIAAATTNGGMTLTAFAYPWVAVYSAQFFPRRAVILQTALIAVCFGAGLILDRLPNTEISWLIVTGTVGCTSLILGNLNESLRRQTETDQLTGLLNRKGFLAAATRQRAQADRSGEALTLVVIDLDDFKEVNDGEGHAAGDALLAALGIAWRSRLRAGDVLARHGGDEFVLLLPATKAKDANEALRRLDVSELQIKWSAGISEWREGEDIDACLARADRELYLAKQALPSSRSRLRARRSSVLAQTS